MTCIFWIIFAGKFWVAVFTSPPKKSLPLIRTRFTDSPCAVTLPSLSTSTPCNFFNASSATAPSRSFRSFMVYSRVSLLTTTVGTPSTTTSCSICEFCCKVKLGIIYFDSPLGILNSFSKRSKPKFETVILKVSDLTLSKIKIPAILDPVVIESNFDVSLTVAPATIRFLSSFKIPCTLFVWP